MPLPNDQVLTVAEMRAAEQRLIDGGETVDSLMLAAGQGAAEWVWRIADRRPVTVLCGPGNNGGDGYVIAESLRQRGVPLRVVAPIDPATDAARNARAAFQGDVQTSGEGVHGAVLVDCLFGSGLTRPLGAELLTLLQGLSAAHPIRIAVDLPSGVESDSGHCLNHGLPDYRLTVCLGAWKYAHWMMPAAAKMGARRMVPIGISQRSGTARVLARPQLSAPHFDAHKYSRGLLAVVAGEMPGAGVIASQTAMRGGAGYVKLMADAPPSGIAADLVVVSSPLDQALADPRIAAVLVGPGLGRSATSKARLDASLKPGLPTVLDADALVLLTPDQVADHPAPVIATPHEGELARLCKTFGVAGENKLARARGLSAASGMVVVAKGADTVIAAPDGDTILCPAASSWLSVAGSGDALAGLIASRLASGARALNAAAQGVWLHGEAARLAGPALTASDLATHIPAAVKACL